MAWINYFQWFECWGITLSVTTMGSLNIGGCLGLTLHLPAPALNQEYVQVQLQSMMSNVVFVATGFVKTGYHTDKLPKNYL